MRIVFVEIENFRGIKKLEWAPAAKINCLIGPGDSTKTTILDAIELAINFRSYPFADDSDFFNADYKNAVRITVTLADLPPNSKQTTTTDCICAVGIMKSRRSKTNRAGALKRRCPCG